MNIFDDMRDSNSGSNRTHAPVSTTGRTQRKTCARQATLVIAAPVAQSHQQWITALQQGFAVCDVAERRALEQVMSDVKPDVLVVDLALHGLRRVNGLRDIQRLNPATRIIALTEAPDEEEGLSVLKAGAKGYCTRTIEPDAIMKAVAAVRNGEIWASRKLVRALVAELVSLTEARRKDGLQPEPDPRLEHLTERQRLVAVLISRGASNKEIGNRLKISERTVKAHLTEAFRNVGVSDRLQLALLLQGHSSAFGDD